MASTPFYSAAGRSDGLPNPPADATDTLDAPSDGVQKAATYATAIRGEQTSHHAQGQQPSVALQLEDNHAQLAELLEAAAKATSESQRHNSSAGPGLRKIARNTDLRGTAMQEEEESAAGQKRKRTASPDGERLEGGGDGAGDGAAGGQSPRKRSRQTPTVESHTPVAHTPMSTGGDTSAYQSPQAYPNNIAMTDARAVGVHSAAALFRASSASTAKKYTRPPMSKLFASLQLTPENFLRLQAAAKQYMLDEDHPERQACVGNRGKGDTDMVKLRLFNCVRDFLNDGIGDRFFGLDVPAPDDNEMLEGETEPGRKWIWPRDGNKIISLVTPLLRRMVTNERQRQYAQETRKTGNKKKGPSDTTAPQAGAEDSAMTGMEGQNLPQSSLDPSLNPPHHQAPNRQPAAFVQPAAQYPRFVRSHPPPPHSICPPPNQTAAAYEGQSPSYPAPPGGGGQGFHPPAENIIQVLITKNNTKLLPRIDMPSYPSTPHHTMPLADLMKIMRDEVRGLLKRGLLDPGQRRGRRPAESSDESSRGGGGGGAEKTYQQQQAGDDAASNASPRKDAGLMLLPEQILANQLAAATAAVADGHAPNQTQTTTTETQHQTSQSQSQGPTTRQQPTTHAAAGQEGGGSGEDEDEDDPSSLLLDGVGLEIRALTGRGLVLIKNEDEWRAVLAEVGRAVWMEGILRVVVEVII